MAKAYQFADLVTIPEASRSEITHWVQTKVIRPDIRETSGTGQHRTFGFLDLLEACVARRLNQLPGGMTTVQLSQALDCLRFEASLDDTPWRRFLMPATRDVHARFWLGRSYAKTPADSVLWKVMTDAELPSLLATVRDVPVVVLPLHALLLDLEKRTNDHTSADACAAAWKKEQPRRRRRPSAVYRDDRRVWRL